MKKTLRLFLAGGMIALVAGCQSTAPKPQAQPESETAATAAVESSDGASLIAMRAETSPAPRLVLKTTGSPAYTSYNPQPDVFVIDFSRTAKANGVTVPTNLPEFVASVAVDEAIELGAPLTRVTVRFTRPIPTTATALDDAIVVGFNEPSATLAEVVPDPPPTTRIETLPEPIAEPTVTRTEMTIAERALPNASILTQVSTQGSGSSLAISLEGDGRIDYTAFRLSNPLRIVLDLKGVRNKVDHNTMQLGDPYVQRIRVSQFQVTPLPITRVVLDLDELVEYRVVRKPSGAIQLAFGEGSPDNPPQPSIQVAAATVPQGPPAVEPIVTRTV
ncbi:MAG TPA: AMIN domain-containing protein, partial [Thermoanaerobaculia bacterium]